MDLSKLSASELRAYQKKLEQYLKNNEYASTINKAAADAYTGTNPEYSMPQKTVAQKARAADRALATLGMANERSLMSEGAKDFLKSYEAAKQTFPEQEAFKKYAKESLKNTYAPMETPYGKSFLSYTPEGKIAGKTGAALRGLGKVASRVAGPLGAALTALDLAQGLGEVQEKGAAKIAEDYRKEQERKALAESEDMGDKVIEKMNPIQSDSKQYSLEENVPSSAKSQLVSGARRDYQSSKYSGNPSMKNESTEYSPEERAKLKEILSKYRANAALRSGR